MRFPDPEHRWPPIEAIAEPHVEAMQAHRVLVQHCAHCDTWLAPAQVRCDACGAPDPAWREAAGRGTVHTFIVMHRAFHPAFEPLVPYVVAVVELAEGPRLMTNLVGCAPAAVHVGMPVTACFETVEGREVLQFRPAEETDT